MLGAGMDDDPNDQGPPGELSAEETMVMLGHFAGASFTALSTSTGLTQARLEAIITRLTRLGLIEALPIPIEDEPQGPAVRLAPLGAPAPEPPGPTDDAPSAEDVEDVVDKTAGAPGGEVVEETREYQKLFAAELRPLPTEERVALAGTVTGARLCALCFDPDPMVIAAILENTAAGVEHARLVAFHHRTARGLEELVRRASVVSDPLVHHRLVRNPALNEAMLRRMMGNRRLLEIYKVSLDRDVPERTRGAARALFRARFAASPPEERVEIVWVTEGRVLSAMTGLTFDSRTTSILCSRSYASIMLVQSLARFPATPPLLLAHLLRQPLVKRQAHLKNQLLQHPNTPSDAKRRS